MGVPDGTVEDDVRSVLGSYDLWADYYGTESLLVLES